MFDSKLSTLPNGLNLVSIKKDTQVFSLHAGVKIGSIYEEEDEKGICHLIEHMLFKGTTNRSNEVINKELEELGGEYNAYTDLECTVCSVTALSEELEKSLEIVSDMLLNSNFPEEELKKEKGVVLAEIRTSKDDVEDYSFKRINELSYINSPLKYDTLGTEKHVKSFTRKKLMDYYESHYIPNDMYVSIVSPYDHDFVYKLVEKYFKSAEAKESISKKVNVEANIPGIHTSYKKDIEQSTIIYLFTFPKLTKEEEMALKILNHKLGDSGNSMLFRNLREERGLAYDVYTNLDTTDYVRSLYIYTAVAEENIKESIKVIDKCLEDINEARISFDDATINLMKKVLKTGIVFTLEDPTDLSNYVIHQMIDGESIQGFLDDMKKIEEIKEEDIYKIAHTVLSNPTIHILKSNK